MRLEYGFPAYMSEPDEWARLHRFGAGIRHVVVNADSGPGARPHELLAERVQRSRSVGQRTLGYVATGYGARPVRPTIAEIGRWVRWYGVDGIFFDEVSTRPDEFARTARIAAAARSLGLHVVLNPGAPAPAAMIDLADLIVTFENTAGVYRSSPFVRVAAQPWVRDYPPERFWHLVYGVAPADLSTVRRLVRRRHVGVVTFAACAHPSHVWGRLPPDRYLGRRGPR